MSDTIKKYYTYIVRCEDNSLYTGITTDIERRFGEHFFQVSGKCAKYTMSHKVAGIEAVWQTSSRADASKLEYYIKRLPKLKKEKLIYDNKYFEIFFCKTLDVDNFIKLDNCSLNI